MKESELKQRCIHHALSKGAIYARMTGPKGTPDHVFFKNNKCLIVEFKTETGVLSEAQKYQIKNYKESGVIVYVINNLSDFLRLFTSHIS